MGFFRTICAACFESYGLDKYGNPMYDAADGFTEGTARDLCRCDYDDDDSDSDDDDADDKDSLDDDKMVNGVRRPEGYINGCRPPLEEGPLSEQTFSPRSNDGLLNFCTVCGKRNGGGNRFCGSCGASMVDQTNGI